MKKELKKQTTAGSLSKEKALNNKNLLPDNLKKSQEKPSGTATDKKETILPEKSQEENQENIDIQATGAGRCGGELAAEWLCKKTGKSGLTDKERTCLAESLDEIEIDIWRRLPEGLRKKAQGGSPYIKFLVAAGIIFLARILEKPQEKPSGTASEKKETILPEKHQEEIKIKPAPGESGNLALSLQPIKIEDNKPTP